MRPKGLVFEESKNDGLFISRPLALPSPLFRSWERGDGVLRHFLFLFQTFAINRILRLIHTLRHLRLRQVVYQLYYRATGKLTRVGQVARPQVQGEVKGAKEEGPSLPVRFNFLNQEVTFVSPAAIDWNYAANGKLWVYNLNYFEFLQGMDAEEGLVLIRSWIAGAAGHRDGWEPYPTSLRLVSWIRFFTERTLTISPVVASSIRAQYDALWGKLEYHLGGNHLLENAIALCYTGAFLNDQAGLAKARKLLATELKEQYLPDGAHFELSGMYHVILLDRLLTLWHGLQTFPAPAAPPEKTALQTSLERQLGWLKAFATPAGRYAHFNDSTHGIAPDVATTLSRAHKLGLAPTNTALKESGYRRWATDRLDLWIDAAAIGPDYIPGHAHADNLTFVLHVGGAPYIVDPAISTYEKNARRAWERSTEAHNTVTVGGQNSSDVWGGFRVGKRARTTIFEEKAYSLTAGHNGYGIPIRRTWQLWNDRLIVSDTLPEGQEGVARLYFDHRCELKLLRGHYILVNNHLRIKLTSGNTQLLSYEQAIGWNKLAPAQLLEIAFVGTLKAEISLLS